MCLLFETIKVKGNSLMNIGYHNSRLNNSRRALFGAEDLWDIQSMIALPDLNPAVIYRCKFIYGLEFHSVDFIPYEVKPLKTLRLIAVDKNLYPLKYLDRTLLDQYKQQNSDVDDVIFVQNNQVSDCSYANLVFYDNHNWITPANPMLKGTKRRQYIEQQIIKVDDIDVTDIMRFSKMKIINAMIDLEDSPEVNIGNIFRT